MTELKPCPFCGGEAKAVSYSSVGQDGWIKYAGCVTCFRCYVSVAFSGLSTDPSAAREKASEAWNRRVNDGD